MSEESPVQIVGRINWLSVQEALERMAAELAGYGVLVAKYERQVGDQAARITTLEQQVNLLRAQAMGTGATG